MASKSTFGEINKEYWDTQAKTVFKQEWVQNLMRQIAENLQSHIDWIGIRRTTATGGMASQDTPVKMLDYACGSGIASRALFPYVSEIRGIDVSDGMVEQYNNSVRSFGVPESQIFAIQGDLAAPLTEQSHPSLGSSDFFQFDIIVVSMALHHIDAPKGLMERLVERLNEDGVLLIIDWTLDQEGHQPQSEGNRSLRGNAQHSAAHTVRHEGFSKEQMETLLRSSGCNEVDYLVLDEPSKVPPEIGGHKQLFFARGKKSALK